MFLLEDPAIIFISPSSSLFIPAYFGVGSVNYIFLSHIPMACSYQQTYKIKITCINYSLSSPLSP